ncbi:carboxypeptidase-like regulatory domain-containing protein [Rufibacter quisquiliarum]|uniref:CarboxypepD_reg-like domain-containing protein n=1 Tax=Rufibacter quisquiliarum TaxID=1549639 RepID=A0A839GHZ9_9BACT|nr:carboxypeptidase-like regulatory domain-containing protein [Rufibacter quisquiliarum]MBA9078502.1 hypothetical protein [Rufibacter quisquiliarum]
MPTQALTVSIPTPCQEDWTAMTPHSQGRYCQSCQKTVVDFTTMTDAEVVHWLGKQKGETCGRFKNKQLERELMPTPISQNKWTWKAAALGVLVWISAKDTHAKEKPPTSTFQQTHLSSDIPSPNQPNEYFSSDSTLILKGQILDSLSKKPLSGVSIVLKGTTIGAPTDMEGNFTLEIPQHVSGENSVVVLSYLGYRALEKSTKAFTGQTKTIFLHEDPDAEISTGIVVTGVNYKWYSPRGLYYRIRNLFH